MTLTGWKLILNRVMIIPQRYVLGVMGLFALANSFTMRVCLSMTITQMVTHRAPTEHIIGETCPDSSNIGASDTSDSNITLIFEGRKKYVWDEATQGFLLSAFYYGYVLTHLPGGLLAEKFGGKWTVGLGLLSTSVATILTPWAVTVGGAIGLFIIRVIEGMGEGPVTPAFVLLLARWAPPSERSRFGAMIFGGAQIGNIFGPYISGLLLANGGDWANVFYVFGGLGLIWFIFWSLLCYSTPTSHPYISDKERDYLKASVTASGLHKKLDPVPFKAILRSPALWVLVLAAVGHDWGYFTMITDLPKYFSDVLKFNIQETGLMSALPYIAMYVCSFVMAGLCDLCVRKKWHSIGTGRKIYTTVSSSVPAVFIILASYSGCDRLQAVGLFIASMAFMGGFYSSVKINAMDIAPNYAGTCSAFVNGIAAISGIITPYLIGLLTPDRYVLGIMGLWAVCNAYTMRVCLNLAVTQMVKSSKNSSGHYDPNACPDDSMIIANATVSTKPYAIFEWSEPTQGLILSGFYYGYAITHVPGGYLAERYGGKWTLGVGLLSTAVFTLLTPVVVKAGGATWLFILRVLQGMGEGPTMPALMIMLARWVPPHERGRQGAIVFGGAQIGNIFGSFMSGFLMAGDGDWANVFYFFGVFGILWFLFWSLLCYSTPNTHPYISDEERKYLNEHVTSSDNSSIRDPVPWKAIVRSVPVWALVFAAIGHDWGYYTMVTDLPKYMTDVLKFNIAATGTLTAIPYLAMWISSFIFGLVCDYCVKKNWHSIKTGRIIHTTIAATGPAICIILASYAGCDRLAAVAYFIASMALMGGFYSGMKVNALDLAPNYAGSLTAMINGTSTISGIITPYLIGLLTPDSTLAEWRVAFWVCFAVLVGTNVVYCFWADGKQQWWDDIKQYGYPDDWKHGSLTKSETDKEKSKKAEATSL